MTDESTDQTYEQLTQAAMAGDLPQPEPVCKDCAVQAIPFAVQRDEKRDVDRVLGIPSFEGAATIEWFIKNRWIRDPVQNFRDTYLLRVLDSFGEQFGDAALARFSAFLRTKGIELVSLDFEMELEDYVTPVFFQQITNAPYVPPTFHCDGGNFVFNGDRVYFWSFVSANFVDATPIGPQGERGLPVFSWQVSGQYAPAQAARDLMASFKEAEKIAKEWTRIWGALEAALGVLALVPVIGVAEQGIAGAYVGVRYALAVLDAALAANAVGSGSRAVITGEGIDIGEELFASLGKLADPKNGEERGRQVFMFINFALIARDAAEGARWILRSVRKDPDAALRYDVNTLSEAERKRLQDRDSATVSTVEIHVDMRADPRTGEQGKKYIDRPSHDTTQSQVGVEASTGKADFAVMTRTQRDHLKMHLIHTSGNVHVQGRLCKVVGDAGEEALVEMLVHNLRVNPERILGYSSDRRIVSKLGLQNRSGHGLDLMIWVPPPPSMTVRRAEGGARHQIEGVDGKTTPTETWQFTEDTLLVFESKATLGRSRTPKFNSTQDGGGKKKIEDLFWKISRGRGGWDKEKMLEFDPRFPEKLEALGTAVRENRLQSVHAQVFFDSRGQMNPIVGGGTGIQLNRW